VKENTLVLTSSLTSVRQWKRELLDKTTLPADAIWSMRIETNRTRDFGDLSDPATAPAHPLSFPIFNCLAPALGLIILRRSTFVACPDFPHYRRTARRRLGLTATRFVKTAKKGMCLP